MNQFVTFVSVKMMDTMPIICNPREIEIANMSKNIVE